MNGVFQLGFIASYSYDQAASLVVLHENDYYIGKEIDLSQTFCRVRVVAEKRFQAKEKARSERN
jgi:hypothetical protein